MYVNDAFAADKANAEASGKVFNGTSFDYYNHPHNADGVRINELEESVIEKYYKSFCLSQLTAACRKLSVSYHSNGCQMKKAEMLSTLDDYFAGRKGKILHCYCCLLNSIHSHFSFS